MLVLLLVGTVVALCVLIPAEIPIVALLTLLSHSSLRIIGDVVVVFVVVVGDAPHTSTTTAAANK